MFNPVVIKSENDLDDQLLPILHKGLRIIIWTLGVIIALNNAGYNVTFESVPRVYTEVAC